MSDIYSELNQREAPSRPLTQGESERILSMALQKVDGPARPAIKAARTRRPLRMAAAIAAAFCLLAGGAAAAGYLMTPRQVAEELQLESLADAFDTPDAVYINETQSAAGYHVTLLGLVSGEALSNYWSSDWGETPPQRSYALLVVAHSDGTPMPAQGAEEEEFTPTESLVSPLVQGEPMVDCNLFTLHGARYDLSKNDVHYILMECNNVEPFADRTVYLAVQQGAFPNERAYTMNETTGLYTANRDFEGYNFLFTLPLDPGKADPAQAAEIARTWTEPAKQAPADPDGAADNPLAAYLALTPDEVKTQGTLLTTETVAVSSGLHGRGWYYGQDGFLKEGWPYGENCIVAQIAESGEGAEAILFTHNADETLTVESYRLP